ncbi:hypothetical protein VF724_07335 [Paenibacillaceae bacterium T2]|uniref:Uncharacterized protein n=2 Tax=Ferviditalea candida TaxID=3108399 RepID=A0ABU5ZG52_9BACL|nr:hypothetical protein [Paenibacillaceae bacterium T2]
MEQPKLMFIDGEWVRSISAETLKIRNPGTGESVGSVTFGVNLDAAKAIQAASFRSRVKLPAGAESHNTFNLDI